MKILLIFALFGIFAGWFLSTKLNVPVFPSMVGGFIAGAVVTIIALHVLSLRDGPPRPHS